MKRDAFKRQEELKQEEKDRKNMKELISKYLAEKDIEYLGYVLKFCCEDFWNNEITTTIENRYRGKTNRLTEYTIRAIHKEVLDKAINERPECVNTVQNFRINYTYPSSDEYKPDELLSYEDAVKASSELLAEINTKEEERAARRPESIDPKFWEYLENQRYDCRLLLSDAESSKKQGLSSSELDAIAKTIKMHEESLDFLDSLEKIGRLFNKKGIETDYSKILSIFSEVIQERINKEHDTIIEKVEEDVKLFYEEISIKLGDSIEKENVIREFLGEYAEEGDYDIAYLSLWVSRLFEKFNIGYEKGEVEKLIEKVKEEIELEQFEQNLGTSQQKQKSEIGDFTELNGYEFEDYLKRMFELLGYTAIQTSLSGDQGADLILSKEDEKIVVQAKKYEGKVSNNAVQEIAAAKNHYDADKAMVVTNSSFTKSAMELALSNDVELWDGTKLRSIIRDLES